MKKLMMVLLSGLMLLAGGCGGGKAGLPVTGAATLPQLKNDCVLLDGQDLAGLFPSAQVTHDPIAVSLEIHPVFSMEHTPLTEVTCVFYASQQQGQQSGEMLQVSYWVDIPDPGSESSWSKVWADAKAASGQPVSGAGGDAFFDANNGRLSFLKNGLAVTVEALDTRPGADTSPAGLLDLERKIAQDIQRRLP